MDGYAGVCKDCRNAQWRERYALDPEYRKKRAEKGKRWALNNPEKAKAKSKRSNASRSFEQKRADNRKSQYGLSEPDYRQLCALEGGRCAVCKERRRLVIDHNHATGVVRGLLCYRCNTMVGHYEKANELRHEIESYLKLRGEGWNSKCAPAQEQAPQSVPQVAAPVNERPGF